MKPDARSKFWRAVAQSNRRRDSSTRKESRPLRSKEEAHDYRYFPDPDLLPLVLEQSYVDELAAALPELPDEKKRRFMDSYGLSAYDAGVLVAEQANADFYEAVLAGASGIQTGRQLGHGKLLRRAQCLGLDLDDAPVDAKKLGGLLDLIADGTSPLVLPKRFSRRCGRAARTRPQLSRRRG